MAYEDFKDLNRTTATDHVLRDKAFNLAKNPKYDEYKRWLALYFLVYNFSNKKTSGERHS